MDDTGPAEAHTAPSLVPRWRRVADFPLVTLLIFTAALVLVLFLSNLLLSALAAPLGITEEDRWLAPLLTVLFTAPPVVLTYKFLARRLGEAPRDDLRFDASARDFPRGALIALALMSTIVAVAAALGGYRVAGWGGSTSLAFYLLLAGVQAGFLEEILMRGVLFRFLEEFGGSWFALAASGAAFGFAHAANPGATTLSSLAIALEAGMLLGGAYMLTRNLWLAVGLHFGWNFSQGYLWDVAVSGMAGDGLLDARAAGDPLISGGAFGLEASLGAMVLATALGVWLVVLAVRRGRVVRPWWVRRRLGLPLPSDS